MTHPPFWAEALLRSLLRPADRDPVSGDLLEEYRAVKRPTFGAARANAWYVQQVLSVGSRLLWPCVIVLPCIWAVLWIAGLRMSSLAPVNRSLVPAPGVSLLDGTVYFMAACYGAHRTRLIRTGLLASAFVAATNLVWMFLVVVLQFPDLPATMIRGPFMLVILATFFAVAVGFAMVIGLAGSVLGRLLPESPRHART